MESMEPVASPPSLPPSVPSVDSQTVDSQTVNSQTADSQADPAQASSNLTNSNLTNSNLTNSNLANSNLANSNLIDTPLPEASPPPTTLNTTLNTLADVVQPHLLTNLKHLNKYEEAVLKGFEVEDLHDLRVTWRQLRVILQMLAPVLALSKPKLLKNLQTVTTVIGGIRDTDVLLEQSNHLRSQFLSLPEQLFLAKVTDQLTQQRAKHLKKIQKMLLATRHDRLKQHLHQALTQACDRPVIQQPAIALVPELLSPHWAALWLHPGWWVELPLPAAIDPIDPTAIEPIDHSTIRTVTAPSLAAAFHTLHDLRKAIKRVRYEITFFKALYPRPVLTAIEPLKALQGKLGDLQDTVVLMTYFDQRLKPKQKRRFTQLNALLDQQLQTQWQKLQIDRATCLDITYRTELRQWLFQPQG
ncbi:MAG: hypothetical protein B0A82_19080 [Alkalinema sp. CACIAM 70d]|nr:MAG: hypothetical protein B0A82_19080 [Alkalinema sp. CACIAM 70d]